MNPPQEKARQSPRRAHRAWSLYIGSVAGIPIYLHVTFLMILVLFWAINLLVLAIAVFASVVLHELGHALMARRYGIGTEDIVLYPIGGVARLRSLGEKIQEFWIALAGPSVNVIIIAVLFVILQMTGWWVPFGELFQPVQEGQPAIAAFYDQAHILQQVLFVNMILVVFNLIPAFPMDGGRVLRSLLTLAMPKERATSIAAGIGQALAVVFVAAGLFFNIILVFIGIFVFIAAGQEAMATRSQALMEGHTIRDAMITRFEVLNHGDSLGKAADLLLETSQQEFPIMSGGEVIGVLSRKALLQGLAQHGRDQYVAQAMERAYPRTDPDRPLQDSMDQMRAAEGLPILVFDDERLVGYVTNENLMEYLMIRQARRQEE